MANPRIIPKKSVQAGKVPLASDLVSGEVAINYADQQWYGKHPSTGAIIEIGAPYLHSHDQLLSLDKANELELTNGGSLVLSVGVNSTALTATKSGPIVVGDSTDSTPIHSVRTMPQESYDQLTSYDANTLYFATGTPQQHYTEAETDALLAGKSDTGHTHTVSEVSGAVENVFGVAKIERVTEMPASPDPNTLYLVIP